jgi:N,N'-diacetylchitobiose transport system permease protein
LAANGNNWTLPVWLEEFITPTAQVQWNAIFAGSVLYTLPVLIFFLIIQRRMMAGLTAGAVKG